MLILGIDSSAGPASAALVEDGCLLGEFYIHTKQTHSQTLLPMVQQLTFNRYSATNANPVKTEWITKSIGLTKRNVNSSGSVIPVSADVRIAGIKIAFAFVFCSGFAHLSIARPAPVSPNIFAILAHATTVDI